MRDLKLLYDLTNLDNFDVKKFNELDLGICINFSDTNMIDSRLNEVLCDYQVKLKDFKNSIAIHGVAFDLNPGSPDKKVVELTKFRYKQCIYAAKSLGASYVIFHSQINPWIREEKLKEKKSIRQIEFWNELADEIGENELKILIENVYEKDYHDLLMLIEIINSPKVGLCFDIGHFLCSSKQTMTEWICNLREYIELIHLHWNDGSYDSHQPPDEKLLLKIKKYFKKFSINPAIELEYEAENLEKEICRIRKYLN